MILISAAGTSRQQSAAQLNGSSQYFWITRTADWNFGSSSFTLTSWVTFSGVNSPNGVFAAWNGASFAWQLAMDNLRKLYLVVSTNSSTYTQLYWPNALSLNTAYFVMGQWNASTGKLGISVNGANMVQTNFTGPVYNYTSTDICLGAVQPGQASNQGWWTGMLQYCGAWKGRALTDAEVAWLCNGPELRSFPEVANTLGTNLIYYNEMNELNWTPIVGATTTPVGSPVHTNGFR